MPKNFSKLIFSIGICLGVGGAGSLFTFSAIPTWYATLNKPSFSPPNSIFGPVWTILYTLMGISLYLIWQKKTVPVVFWVQLTLNLFWSVIFFGLRNPIFAFLDIIALWVSIFLMIKSFYRINKLAGMIQIPYFFWVNFASVLNLSIVILNP